MSGIDQFLDDDDSDDYEYRAEKEAAAQSRLSGFVAAIVCLMSSTKTTIADLCDHLIDCVYSDLFPRKKKIDAVFGLSAPLGSNVLSAWQVIIKGKLATAVKLYDALLNGIIAEKFRKWISKDPEPPYGRCECFNILEVPRTFKKIRWEQVKIIKLRPSDPDTKQLSKSCVVCHTGIHRLLKECDSCHNTWLCSDTCYRNHWKSHLENSLISIGAFRCSIKDAWENLFKSASGTDQIKPELRKVFGLGNGTDKRIQGKSLNEIIMSCWENMMTKVYQPSICDSEDVQQALFDGTLPEKFFEWICAEDRYAVYTKWGFNGVGDSSYLKYNPKPEQILLREKNVFARVEWTVPKLESLDHTFCENCYTRNSPSMKIGRVLKLCGKCRKAWYCCKTCQVLHWPEHKALCMLHTESHKLNK
jgi:hypothetical protein